MELSRRHNSHCLRLNRLPSNWDRCSWWESIPKSFAGDCQLPLRRQHFVFDPALLQHPRAKYSCRSTATGFISHVR